MTCQQASEIISRCLDVSPSVTWRVGLRVHTLFCGPCRRYQRQLLRLDAACEEAMGEFHSFEGELSAEARGRIATALDQAPPTN